MIPGGSHTKVTLMIISTTTRIRTILWPKLQSSADSTEFGFLLLLFILFHVFVLVVVFLTAFLLVVLLPVPVVLVGIVAETNPFQKGVQEP